MGGTRFFRVLAACALLNFAGGAGAGVYKCMEGGKLVYSDRRCDADAKPMDSNPSLSGTVTPQRRYRYEDRQRYRGDPRRGDPRGRDYRKASKRGPAVIDRTDPETVKRCNQIKKRRAQLSHSEKPRHVAEAKRLEELQFSDCYGHVNGNQ